ncbi:MAG TPA: hypothetical protein VLK65_28170 [Vicinamibacteria bacterium]|nr:hypothetical protein [Vicinamibacteria bacterium]
MMRRITRRRFLEAAASLPALVSAPAFGRTVSASRWTELGRTWLRESSVVLALKSGQLLPLGDDAGPVHELADFATLSDRFPDIARHFLFEYYPWYGAEPWRHWDAASRKPPDDMATHYVPRLGAYDSRDRSIIEKHARWIAGSGVGSISLSWWGAGSYEDETVHAVLDVMKDHGISVSFGLEPYANDRGARLTSDVLYLMREYGEKRGWDAFLILRNEDGSESPVFKGFRCILPEAIVDCHGSRQAVLDHTPDAVWRQQIDLLRRELRWDFERVFLLADSLDFGRTPASGFDGVGIYDNFISPEHYDPLARGASAAGLVFSFNINPGYDEILLRDVPDASCYQPRPFAPVTFPLDWNRQEDRELAAVLSMGRIRDSLTATLRTQCDSALSNYRRGFFLVYINSFNEWHEGHAFEPMKDDAELSVAERTSGYHNPSYGGYRLEVLTEGIRSLVYPPSGEPRGRA